MRRKTSNEKVVVGQIEKSGTEIVQVIRQRLNGYELVSLPVFSCGRKCGVTEKGLTLHLEQWRAILPMIQRALALELHSIVEPRPNIPVKIKVSSSAKGKDVNQSSINSKCPAMRFESSTGTEDKQCGELA